jgi:hypothetical protein
MNGGADAAEGLDRLADGVPACPPFLLALPSTSLLLLPIKTIWLRLPLWQRDGQNGAA